MKRRYSRRVLGDRFTDEQPLGRTSRRATLDGKRPVVIKSLEPECFLDGRPHPDVLERLSRLQQLPAGGLVPLIGAWQDGAGVAVVWAFDPSPTLAELPAEQRAAAVEAARSAVAALHDTGLVHGNLHERNIVYDGHHARLMHAAGLLHDDPRLDWAALNQIGGGPADPPTPRPASVRWLPLAAAALVAAAALAAGRWLYISLGK
jgi:hypothetical protein